MAGELNPLRNYATIRADMGDYIPPYYRGSVIAGNVLDREGETLADLNADIADVLAQYFVGTATWGLANWERVCGIPVDETKPPAQRRSVIVSKLRGVGTVTVALIKNVAEAYGNGDVEVTEYSKNALPPFSDARWTLYPYASVLANYVGKVAGSVTENPNIAKRNGTNTTLLAPSGFGAEFTADSSAQSYSRIYALDGSLHEQSATANGAIAQVLYSYDLIAIVERRYGAAIPGADTAAKVTWLRANVAKLTGNWHGSGIGPAGNRAALAFWNGSAWAGAVSHTTSITTKISNVQTTSINLWIQSDGFFHMLAYADASDGVTASTINTNYVEIIPEITVGGIVKPNAEVDATDPYKLILKATVANQWTQYDAPVIAGQAYAYSLVGADVNTKLAIDQLKSDGTPQGSTVLVTSANPTTVITPIANTAKLRVYVGSNAPGTFALSNPQLERNSAATAFEPRRPYTIGIKYISSHGVPDNLPDIEAALRDIIPAHLAINFTFAFMTWDALTAKAFTWDSLTAHNYTWDQFESLI